MKKIVLSVLFSTMIMMAFSSCALIALWKLGKDIGDALTDPETPVVEIVEYPNEWTIKPGTKVTLKVSATTTDDGILSYQWYVSDTVYSEDAVIISGETSNVYEFITANEASHKYYFCKVTNTLNGKTASEWSDDMPIDISLE